MNLYQVEFVTEQYYVFADSEDEAIQFVEDNFFTDEDFEELEYDPGYIFAVEVDPETFTEDELEDVYQA